MKFLFVGAPNEALPYEISQLGHEVLRPPETDWWSAMRNLEPESKARVRIAETTKAISPDIVVLHKGWHLYTEPLIGWGLDADTVSKIRDSCKALIYLCFDDPCSTPITLAKDLHRHVDMWLTSCPGITKLFDTGSTPIEEMWLAWDDRVQPTINPRHAVDVAITGHPYIRSYPAPYYGDGFATSRIDLAHAIMDKKLHLGIWGPSTWCLTRNGGSIRFADPSNGPIVFHGWVPGDRIHEVHGTANVTVATHACEGWRYESGRIPYVGGAGGCLIHEDRPGLREEVGDTVAFFPPGDLEAAVDLCAELKKDRDKRDRMAHELRFLVLARHTWRHRAERLVQVAQEVMR